MNNTFLFLDDIRNPEDAFSYTNQKMFIENEWTIVRNYNEFKEHIEKNGLPFLISFDHDLADSHYTPQQYWNDYQASKQYQESIDHKEKTGYECALWLVDYCLDNGLNLPKYYCHSMNPVGKDKIIGLLKNFEQKQNINITNYQEKSMENEIKQVEDFHNLFQYPLPKEPIQESTKDAIQQGYVIFEELKEYFQALGQEKEFDKLCEKQISIVKEKKTFDIVEVSDALSDLLYVVYGAVLKTGLKDYIPYIFDHVHQSNMSKACKTLEEAYETIKFNKEKNPEYDFSIVDLKNNLYLVKRNDGKIIKSINYNPTTIKESFIENETFKNYLKWKKTFHK